jgi:hypothetical protein
MNSWIGDWVHDRKKLNNLTKERAISDIWAMEQSPDYTHQEVQRAMRKAARQLNIHDGEFLAMLIVGNNAN